MRKILVSLDMSYAFSREIWRGIIRYSYEKARWTLWPLSYNAIPEEQLSNFDGTIGFLNDENDGERILRHQKALVNVSNRRFGYRVPSVLNDDLGIGEMAGRYYLEKGYRDFAYFGIDTLRFSALRHEGFEKVIEAAGYKVKKYDRAAGLSVREWLSQLPVATALFCANDMSAFNIIRFCLELDIPVPQHLALLGVDNDETFCQSGIIGMSSVMLASETLGYRAAELLDRQLAGEVITTNPPPIPPLNIVTRLSTDMQAVNDELVRKALRYIQDNVHQNFQVEDLLRQLYVGRRTLERKFKEHLGHSPHYAINRARVEMAKRLLETTEFKMDDIAVRCGFSEARILYRNFRLITGESPARYRKHFR